MYGFVPYQLSGIQAGIQFGHAVVDFGLDYYDMLSYQQWAKYDKTFIVLNGGTTNLNPDRLGTMNIKKAMLDEAGIPNTAFYEPDLGDQLSAVVFLVDDRIYDKETYPDYENSEFFDEEDGETLWRRNFNADESDVEQIVFLRSFLKGSKLA